MQDRDIRNVIKTRRCPFCNDKRMFRSIASHTVKVHGVTAYELREMAGLNRSTSICSPEYSLERKESVLSRPADILALQLKEGRKKETIAQRDSTWRPQGRERQLIDRNKPERKSIFVRSMRLIDAKRSEMAKGRSEEVVAVQTGRIQRANERFMARSSSETISARGKYAASFVKPETHRKAGKIAAPIIRELHKDCEWKENWRKRLITSLQKNAKVPRADYQEIIDRVAEGVKPKDIAGEYKVTARFIRRVATGK